MNEVLERAMTIALVKKLGGRVVVTEEEIREAMLNIMDDEYEPYKDGDKLILQVNRREEV